MKTNFLTRMSRATLLRIAAAATLLVSGGTFATAEVFQSNNYYNEAPQQDLQQVVAPVALYPDALLAQVLAASTYPQDVAAAAQWLRDGGDPAAIDEQNWDASVRGLAHFPEALNLLAENPEWMNQLGSAVLDQQGDVMAAIQSVRNRARQNGSLASNSYQDVVVDDTTVQIIPADQRTVYVPVYEPQTILVERPVYVTREPLIRYGRGITVGVWLRHDCDWRDRTIYVGNWGAHRPWWDRHERFDGRREFGSYADVRPGRFTSRQDFVGLRNPIGVRNGSHDNTSSRWTRDSHKPSPQFQRNSSVRTPIVPRSSVAPLTTSRTNPTITNRSTPTNRDSTRWQGLDRNTPAPTVRSTPTPTPTRTTRSTPTPTVRSTPTPTPTVRSTPTPTPTVRSTPTPTPTRTTRSAPTPTVRSMPTPTPTVRSTPTPTPTVRSTPTPTPTVRSTPTPTPTRTTRSAPTPTPTVRSMPTPTVRSTPTPTPTVRSTPTPTPTVRSTPTPTPTRTTRSAPTPTPTVRSTPTPTVRSTPIPIPTRTTRSTPTPTPTVRSTPTPTVRSTPTPTPTVRSTPTRTGSSTVGRPSLDSGRGGAISGRNDGSTNRERTEGRPDWNSRSRR